MTEQTIKITFDDGRVLEFPKGVSYLEIQKNSGIEFKFPIIGVKSNNEMKALP